MKEVIARAFRHVSGFFASKEEPMYQLLRPEDFSSSDRGLLETLLVSAVDEFRAMPFHAKKFFKPVLDNCQQVYTHVTGQVYSWKTPVDEQVLQRLLNY